VTFGRYTVSVGAPSGGVGVGEAVGVGVGEPLPDGVGVGDPLPDGVGDGLGVAVE